jgi:hypothetical protein
MRGRRSGLLLAVILAGASRSAAAVQWEVKGGLGQQLQYNDNIGFNIFRKASVFGYLLTPALEASRKTETLELVFRGQGDIRRYDDSRWDCENYGLGLDGRYRTRRSEFSVAGGYSRSCSYIQQISDTGFLAPFSRYENFKVAPSWNWQWTARDRLTVDAYYSKTIYTDSPAAGAVNFSGNETYYAALSGSHLWSRRLTLTGGVFFSDIVYSNGSAPDQTVFGAQVGGAYAVSRRWTVSANAGPRWVDTQWFDGASSGRNPSATLGSNANAGIDYKGRLTSFSISYSNTVGPSALGQALQYQTVFANYTHRFRPRLLLDLTANLSRSESSGGRPADNPAGAFDRDYASASAGLAWQFAKDWEIKGSYLYQWQRYKQFSGTADSNIVMLSVNYTWGGIRRAR